MPTLVLRDIGELLTMSGPTQSSKIRAEQVQFAEQALGRVEDAVLIVVDGQVHYAGPSQDAPAIHLLPQPVSVQTARGQVVSPGLCDPHTHLIWAGDRSHEFELRNLGATYQQIAEQGGGIVSTVRATTEASDEALRDGLVRRLDDAIRLGTTLCEVKTGYGLWPDAELRLLRLCHEVAAQHICRISPTFLCHVPPPQAKTGTARAELLKGLADCLATAQSLGADAIDVYCDQGAFTLEETRTLFVAAKGVGLGLRCHAEQFTHTGVAELAAQFDALSVEHLEQLDSAGIRALAESKARRSPGTIANLLPGAALQLRLPWPDAASLLGAGVTVALGTDCNPGSSYSLSQPLMMSLACTYMGLSCAEAWLSVTAHAAQSIGRPQFGRLKPGAPADFVQWEADHYRQVCQKLGGNPVQAVWIGGQPVVRDGSWLSPDSHH